MVHSGAAAPPHAVSPLRPTVAALPSNPLNGKWPAVWQRIGKAWPGAQASSSGAVGASTAGNQPFQGEAWFNQNNPGSIVWQPPAPRLALVPARHTKLVHFVRHGEAYHNLGLEHVEDPHLTPAGWGQAAALRAHLAALRPQLDVEVVIVSPLMRTLETAAAVFGGPALEEDKLWSEGGPLILRQTDLPDRRVAHPALARTPGLPFVAHEACRERIGPNVCDRRRPLDLTRAQVPGVDFTLVDAGPGDAAWDALHARRCKGGRYGEGESEAAITERGLKFLRWLMTRPEARIAVVSHCGFINHTLSAFAHPRGGQTAAELRTEFANCELRSLLLSDEGLAERPDATRFAGGTSLDR